MIFYTQRFWQIVIGVNNKEIGSRPVAPLKACVQINIILLFVVLQKGCPENFVGKRYVYSRP
jgi:hypothetical protein